MPLRTVFENAFSNSTASNEYRNYWLPDHFEASKINKTSVGRTPPALVHTLSDLLVDALRS